VGFLQDLGQLVDAALVASAREIGFQEGRYAGLRHLGPDQPRPDGDRVRVVMLAGHSCREGLGDLGAAASGIRGDLQGLVKPVLTTAHRSAAGWAAGIGNRADVVGEHVQVGDFGLSRIVHGIADKEIQPVGAEIQGVGPRRHRAGAAAGTFGRAAAGPNAAGVDQDIQGLAAAVVNQVEEMPLSDSQDSGNSYRDRLFRNP